MPLIKSTDLPQESKPCSQEEFFAAVSSGNVKILNDHMFYSPEHLKAKDKDGKTALYLAAEAGHEKLTALLISDIQQIDVSLSSIQDPKGSPLHIAAIKGHVKVIKILGSKVGASINSFDQQGQTPILLATQNNQYLAAQALIKFKPDLSRRNWAKENLLAGLIVDKFDEADLDERFVQLYAERGVDFGEELIAVMVKKGYLLFNIILAIPEINVNYPSGSWRETPLHRAACPFKIKFIKPLLRKGADIYAETSDKHTPLEMALWAGEETLREFVSFYLESFKQKKKTARELWGLVTALWIYRERYQPGELDKEIHPECKQEWKKLIEKIAQEIEACIDQASKNYLNAVPFSANQQRAPFLSGVAIDESTQIDVVNTPRKTF